MFENGFENDFFQIYAFLQKIGLLLMLASKQPCKAKRRKIDMYLSFTALAIRVYTSLHKGMMVILSLAISISSYLEKWWCQTSAALKSFEAPKKYWASILLGKGFSETKWPHCLASFAWVKKVSAIETLIALWFRPKLNENCKNWNFLISCFRHFA